MVKLLIGHKGSGKTKKMIFLANQSVDAKDGSIVFINRNHRLMLDLNHRIRVVCMEDYEHITNSDEYIGFVYGIISSDHDIEEIYIESILKYADIQLKDLEEFLTRLDRISQKYGPDFIVSISVEMQELGDFIKKYKILN